MKLLFLILYQFFRNYWNKTLFNKINKIKKYITIYYKFFYQLNYISLNKPFIKFFLFVVLLLFN